MECSFLNRKALCNILINDTGKKDKYVKKKGKTITPELEDYEPLHLECKHFVECIEKGLRPLTDGENGRRVVKVLETAQESLKRGGETVAIAS